MVRLEGREVTSNEGGTMTSQTKVVSLESYTLDGVRYFQVHYGGMPTHAELTTRRIALEVAREQLKYYRSKYRTVVFSRWDGDRGEVRRELVYSA